MTRGNCQYLLHLSPAGGLWCPRALGNPGSPTGCSIHSSGKMAEVFPHPLTTCLGLSQMVSNNVWLLVNFLTIFCEANLCKRGRSFLFEAGSCSVQMPQLCGALNLLFAPVSILSAPLSLLDQCPKYRVACSVWLRALSGLFLLSPAEIYPAGCS